MGVSVSLDVIRQSDRWVVVDKPAGLLSVPGRGPEKQDCVAKRCATLFPAATGPLTVHRLDMETSGLMVLALDPDAHRALSKQFEARMVSKRYEALVWGRPHGDCGEVRLPIRLDIENRPRQIHDPERGKACETHWRVLSSWETDRGAVTHLEFHPVTGRSHQLRVHAAHPEGLGCPILGDSLYGRGDDSPRMMLHATLLAFDDPATGERVTCRSCWTRTPGAGSTMAT